MKLSFTSFKTYSLISLILLFIFSCKQTPEDATVAEKPKIKRDLEAIKKDGKLKALTIYSGTSYFLYKGQAMVYEYELLQRFADYLDLELEMVVVKDQDELITKLNQVEGDILAHGLTITTNRKASVAFTNYLYLTK